MNIVRTQTKGCYSLKEDKLWGSYLKPVVDPDGIDDDLTNRFELVDNFPKIPSSLWSAIVNLYFHFYNKNVSQEVSVIFLRNEDDLTQWRVLVPEQQVTTGSVSTTEYIFKENGINLGTITNCVDIITGEELTYPNDLDNWWVVGSSHVHPFALADFSSIDDDNELGFPGCHILFHSPQINTERSYGVTASIVQNKTRYYLHYSKLIDTSYDHTTYHPKVLNYVTEYKPKFMSKATNKFKVKSTTSKKALYKEAETVSFKTSNLSNDSLTYDLDLVIADCLDCIELYNLDIEEFISLLRDTQFTNAINNNLNEDFYVY